MQVKKLFQGSNERRWFQRAAKTFSISESEKRRSGVSNRIRLRKTHARKTDLFGHKFGPEKIFSFLSRIPQEKEDIQGERIPILKARLEAPEKLQSLKMSWWVNPHMTAAAAKGCQIAQAQIKVKKELLKRQSTNEEMSNLSWLRASSSCFLLGCWEKAKPSELQATNSFQFSPAITVRWAAATTGLSVEPSLSNEAGFAVWVLTLRPTDGDRNQKKKTLLPAPSQLFLFFEMKFPF